MNRIKLEPDNIALIDSLLDFNDKPVANCIRKYYLNLELCTASVVRGNHYSLHCGEINNICV